MGGRGAGPREEPGGLTAASADGDVGLSRAAGTRAGENGTVQSAQEPAQMVPSPASPMSPARAASPASAAAAGSAAAGQPAASGQPATAGQPAASGQPATAGQPAASG